VGTCHPLSCAALESPRSGPRYRGLWALSLVLLLLLWTGPVDAQPNPQDDNTAESDTAAEAQPTEDPARLQEAKQLFREGNRLRRAGNFERALEYYVKSRALVESTANTLNAAACLGSLARFDEALELYERAISHFGEKMTAAERAAVARETRTLLRKVGSLDIVANVPGSLVIDGRARGDLPLLSPVRVLPGSHAVTVVKEGYRSFEVVTDVALGKTTTVRAQLKPLVVAGSIRIDEPELAGADVYVDGALVGQVPWEGLLEPGRHVYSVRLGDRGSAPQEVTVVKGQVALARVVAGRLGQETRFLVQPSEAELLIDGVLVSTGQWRGRLPIASYDLIARADGYVSQTRRIAVEEDGMVDVELVLLADPDHPRWGRGPPGRFVFDALGAFAVAPSLGTGAEETCKSEGCISDPAALGVLLVGRAGYEFPFGLSLLATGGYLRLTKDLSRQRDSSFVAEGTTVPTSYELTDEVEISGPFAGVTVGYRNVFAAPLEVRANLAAGMLFATARDVVSGTASAGGEPIPVAVAQSGEVVHAVDVLLLPDLHLGVRFGGFGVSLGLAAAILLLEGPDLPNSELTVRGDCIANGTTAIDCAPGNALVANERAYGPLVVWLPSVGASYLF